MSRRRRLVTSALVGGALVGAGCSGPDEVVPVRVIDGAIVDGPPPVDAWVDAPSDGVTALPDITLVPSLMSGSVQVEDRSFTAGDCEVIEGCVGGPGLRRLLRFTTVTANSGTGDLYLGAPANNPLFEFSPCHGHFHFSGYAAYELMGPGGVIVTGRKQAFCLLDTIQIDATRPGPRYTCDLQGISAGWADSYPAFLPCQWIDITDVPPGAYTLQVRVNPQRVLAETDYSNNSLDIPVVF